MHLLTIGAGTSGAMRLARPDYKIFLMDRGTRKRRWDLAASFNEQEANKWWDAEAVPEILHENLHPYMTVLALEGVLDSFQARMRTTRSALVGFSLNSNQESGAGALRGNLLELSRDIAVACGDIKGAVDDRTAASVWAQYPLLLTAAAGEPLGEPLDPGAVPRMKLGEAIRNIRSQETELRELVLVASQAASDAQNARTANSLNRLTIWLVVLTIVLVGLGVITVVQDMNKDNKSGSSNVGPSSSPAPMHTAHPTSIQRSSASPHGALSRHVNQAFVAVKVQAGLTQPVPQGSRSWRRAARQFGVELARQQVQRLIGAPDPAASQRPPRYRLPGGSEPPGHQPRLPGDR